MDGENKGNGNTVLLTVIGVATLLVALVGATFAYFSAQITVNSKESIILTTRKPTGLTYAVDGDVLSIPNAVPGSSKTGQFTVFNGDEYVTQTYDLDLVVEENGFTVTNLANYGITDPTEEQTNQAARQLVVTISGSSNKTGRTINLLQTEYNLTDGTVAVANPKFIDNQEIAPGETQTYDITVEFKYYDFKQDNNQGKTLSAYVEISDPRSVSSSTEAQTQQSTSEPASGE